MKTCSKCHQDLPLDDFSKWRYGKDGLRNWCKLCKHKSDGEYRRRQGIQKRKEKIADAEGKECTKCWVYKTHNEYANKSSWCRDCRKQKAEKDRRLSGIPKAPRRQRVGQLLECMQCREFLPESSFSKSGRGSFGYNSYCKSCHKTRFPKTKEEAREASKRYRAKGTYRAAHRLGQFNRKSLIKAQSDGTVTKELVGQVLLKEICLYCEEYTPPEKRTIEHVVALNKGGLHSASNLDMACFSCNSSKRNLTKEEFLCRLNAK